MGYRMGIERVFTDQLMIIRVMEGRKEKSNDDDEDDGREGREDYYVCTQYKYDIRWTVGTTPEGPHTIKGEPFVFKARIHPAHDPDRYLPFQPRVHVSPNTLLSTSSNFASHCKYRDEDNCIFIV